MGEIEAVARGITALSDKGATLKSVAAALVDDFVQELPLAPAAPARVTLTEDLREALEALPNVFGQVQPDAVRMLSDEEHQLLLRERTAVTTIITVLGTRKDAIRDAVANHMDLAARAAGKVDDDTEVDDRGHYVIARKGEPEQCPIPGTNQVWSREYRAGSVTIDGDRLLDLYESGKISRDEYLAFTRETRVFDEDKAFNAMAKDPTLLKVFRQLVKKGKSSTAVCVRKQK